MISITVAKSNMFDFKFGLLLVMVELCFAVGSVNVLDGFTTRKDVESSVSDESCVDFLVWSSLTDVGDSCTAAVVGVLSCDDGNGSTWSSDADVALSDIDGETW